MNKHDIIARLRADLQAVTAERSHAAINSDIANTRMTLRRFQSARLADTHADLLANIETRPAAQFFLDDLYGAADFTQRDADIERLVPIMERMLPVAALHYIAEAIELDALSESLDAEMATRLGEHFTQDDYLAAYRAVGRRADREKQIEHVNSVGHSLCELVRRPFIGTTLSAMRTPAKLTRLSELQQFLERGYDAFKQMKKPEDFVIAIVTRETQILENIFSNKKAPFSLVAK
jgi:hypothetical protein